VIELEQNETIRSRQHDDGAARQSKLAAGGAMALILATLFVMLLFRAPHIVWAILLAAALTMLSGAIALGLLQWSRGPTNRSSPGGSRQLPAGAKDWHPGDHLVEEGAAPSAYEQESLLNIERGLAVDDSKFDQPSRFRQRGLSNYHERKAMRIAVLVAGLLSALTLLAMSLTGGLTISTASGLLGWMAASAFATATVLPGWILRRNSGMRRSAR
jgi:hypothetical protein